VQKELATGGCTVKLDYSAYIRHYKYVQINSSGTFHIDKWALPPDVHSDSTALVALTQYSVELRRMFGMNLSHLESDKSVWSCIYCGTHLALSDKFGHVACDPKDMYKSQSHVWNFARQCDLCGWWVHSHWHGEKDGAITDQSIITTEAVLCRFQVTNYMTPCYLFNDHLRKLGSLHIRVVHVEKLFQAIVQEHFPSARICHIGGTDGGNLDLFVVMHQNGDKNLFVIEAGKNAQSAGELLGFLVQGVWKGVVIGTARDTSEMVAKVKENIGMGPICRQHIELNQFRRDKLVDLLNLNSGNLDPPWKELNTLETPFNPLS
jgi:hypothetical protein